MTAAEPWLYRVREVKPYNGMRSFVLRRGHNKNVPSVLVWLDDAGVTYCGSCMNRIASMCRNCGHCDVVKRYAARLVGHVVKV